MTIIEGLDLGHLGIGRHPASPTSPVGRWREVPASAHTIVKANRAWHAIEHFPYALGASRTEVARLRAVGLVIASSIYAWDQIAEDDQARLADTPHAASQAALITLLTEIGITGEAVAGEVAGIARLFELELAAARGMCPAEQLWRELSPVRSADIRVQLRVIAGLLGKDCRRIIKAIGPVLEVLEVVDDLESHRDDLRAGSFNNYNFLRISHSGADTQHLIDAFVRDRLDDFRRRREALSRSDARLLGVVMLRPRSSAQRRVAHAIAGLPRPMARTAVERLVVSRLPGAVTRWWGEPEFLADAGVGPRIGVDSGVPGTLQS